MNFLRNHTISRRTLLRGVGAMLALPALEIMAAPAKPAPPLRSVFTVHNMAYQGLYDPIVLPEVGIRPDSFTPGGVEFWGKVSFLKAGLVELDGLVSFDLSGLPLDPPPAGGVPRSLEHGGWAVHDWWDGTAGAIGAVVGPASAALTLTCG